MFRIMVNRVKPPKQWELVRPTMAPVEAKVGHHGRETVRTQMLWGKYLL